MRTTTKPRMWALATSALALLALLFSPAADAAAVKKSRWHPRWIEDFEGSDWGSNWGIDSIDYYLSNRITAPVTPDQLGKSFRVTASGNNDGYTGMGAILRPMFSDLGIKDGQENLLSYSFYVPDNWNPYAGGKLPGLAGISRGLSTGETPGGGDYDERGWSGRLMWLPAEDGNRDHARLSSYLYVRSAAGKSIYDNRNGDNGHIYGIQIMFRENPNPDRPWSDDNPLLHVERGAWNRINIRYRMNTPGRSDGLFRAWLNGELGVDLDDVQYRTSSNAQLSINELMFDSFYGGPSANETTQSWAFDNVSVNGL